MYETVDGAYGDFAEYLHGRGCVQVEPSDIEAAARLAEQGGYEFTTKLLFGPLPSGIHNRVRDRDYAAVGTLLTYSGIHRAEPDDEEHFLFVVAHAGARTDTGRNRWNYALLTLAAEIAVRTTRETLVRDHGPHGIEALDDAISYLWPLPGEQDREPLSGHPGMNLGRIPTSPHAPLLRPWQRDVINSAAHLFGERPVTALGRCTHAALPALRSEPETVLRVRRELLRARHPQASNRDRQSTGHDGRDGALASTRAAQAGNA